MRRRCSSSTARSPSDVSPSPRASSGCPPSSPTRSYRRSEVAYWIKQFGRANAGVADDWLAEVPERGQTQSFPANNRPSGIAPGDRLVLRPVGWKRFCAVAEVVSPIVWRDGPERWRRRWPWLVEIRLLRATARVSDGPTLADLAVSPLSLRQHSHIRLDAEQGRLAETLIPAL